MKNLELIEGTKMIAPEEVDITKVGYFDEIEYELWNAIKKYLMLFGIELENQDEPDWATVETVQDKIVQVLQEAGVNFKTKTTHKEVISLESNSNKFVRTYPVREKQLIREPMTYMIFFVPFYIY